MAVEAKTDQKIFSVEKVDPLQLYGVADQHLKMIEKNFPVELIARGNKIKIIGSPETIQIVENILSELIFIANKNNSLNERDVETVINISKAETKISPVSDAEKTVHSSKDLDEVILFTQRGFIKPRTSGQQKIVTATQKNDIVVIVGPAGTGKWSRRSPWCPTASAGRRP